MLLRHRSRGDVDAAGEPLLLEVITMHTLDFLEYSDRVCIDHLELLACTEVKSTCYEEMEPEGHVEQSCQCPMTRARLL